MAFDYGYLAVGGSGVALLYALYLVYSVRKQDQGNAKMVEISTAVRQGADEFLRREYRVITPIAAVIAVLIFVFIDIPLKTNGATAAGFLVGAFLSALAGYVGMAMTVRTSSRTAEAARKGLGSALTVAFRGGGVMGMAVVGFGLLGVSLFYIVFQGVIVTTPAILAGLGFGASLIAMFMRVSGGIYTKAADVGADLVGKTEAGIPEDDPRNPAVIADNVGDNVGDCAGMGADIYESFVVISVAALILAALITSGSSAFGSLASLMTADQLFVFPLLLGASGIVGSILGGLYIRKSISKNPMGALNTSLLISAVIAVAIDAVASEYVFKGSSLGWSLLASSIVGIVVVVAIERVADYFTSYNYKPVKFVAEASQTGAATNFLAGFSTGLQSTAPSAVVLVLAILISYFIGYYATPSTVAESSRILVGVYSTAVAAMAELSLTGVIMSIDSFGPITDNANGIVEMAGLEAGVREVTDELDAVGNTTKATTKAFAVMSAALAAVALFFAFQDEANTLIAQHDLFAKYGLAQGATLTFALSDPRVVIGIFIGALLPFYFSSFLIQAVGRAAIKMVNEVRRQFKEIPGIMEGTAKPDYARCVGISTTAALRELAKPALLAVATPLVVGFILGPLALGGLLIGSVASGVFLAFMMTNGGAAWDNAKKYIELGNYGGKKTPVHAAAVMGDTVGDPFKDTAGPAINSLIKVLNTISIVFISAIVLFALFV
ncbi:MAG: sodium-translocating pyrophosphatase [Nitrososphaerota archaeon]|nr:sodium-translocating pyrophosphatase [Nitrososphaerota archaeon]MDG6957732.1 sodium-translocating pyrophosphatase [Nitrososphaerota archaeon]MDG6960552.1 sodium-translocating pyrophosphatase [Nitrososphaerota archaeon]MDG6976145.1 sodium-translocating pyrophosphatase [Nitrososphaerota archaeon]MDG6981034.1 sodium-translocating pyrophosphatase [Nitrososphaerota archaeon]